MLAQSNPPAHYTTADHARFKFLLSLDGATVAGRFAKLLHTNSVVLKEESPWVEYFYYSLQPGVHYLPIFSRSMYDLFDAVRDYSDARSEMEAVTKAAQDFSEKYLCPSARALYWQQALLSYVALFESGQMENYIENMLRPAMQSAGMYNISSF